jgi:homoserine O-succinyltransferase/O-acetyltransferase
MDFSSSDPNNHCSQYNQPGDIVPFNRSARASDSIRIAVMNIMPQEDRKATEAMFRRAFSGMPHPISLTWLHPDASLPSFQHTANHYKNWQQSEQNFDAVILTGAPHEYRAWDEISYNQDLRMCLDQCRDFNIPVLAVCWGAMLMLNHQAGLDKRTLSVTDHLSSCDGKTYCVRGKLSGFEEYQILGNSVLGDWSGGKGQVVIPVSRHVKYALQDVTTARAQGWQLALQSATSDLGCFVHPETGNVAMLSHPEYSRGRIQAEYDRDIALLPEDLRRFVAPPKNPHLEDQAMIQGQAFYRTWLEQVVLPRRYPKIETSPTAHPDTKAWAFV